jgi:hypothetical protein
MDSTRYTERRAPSRDQSAGQPPARRAPVGSVADIPRTYKTELSACTCIRKVFRTTIRIRICTGEMHSRVRAPGQLRSGDFRRSCWTRGSSPRSGRRSPSCDIDVRRDRQIPASRKRPVIRLQLCVTGHVRTATRPHRNRRRSTRDSSAVAKGRRPGPARPGRLAAGAPSVAQFRTASASGEMALDAEDTTHWVLVRVAVSADQAVIKKTCSPYWGNKSSAPEKPSRSGRRATARSTDRRAVPAPAAAGRLPPRGSASYTAARSASARSVRSQEKSGSVRPKCP